MLAIQDLEKSFGARTLFEGVTLTLTKGHRYGLVGANGSGKTTLLKILAGDEAASHGTVSVPKGTRVGVLRQDHFLSDDERIVDLAMMGDDEVWSALRQQEQLSHEHDVDPHAVAELSERVRILDGYTLEARASAVLEGLGIAQRLHREPLRILSGGFKLRVLLAQVLLGRPDLLLLDEPTNHLDILSIRWLEKFLASYEGCAVVISHDQRFLDNVVSDILDVDYETITVYPGSFSKFEIEKAATRQRKETEIERQQEIIAHKREFVERFGAKATKAKQAQSRLKQIEKIEVEELKSSSRRAPRLKIEPLRPSGRDVLTVKGVAKSYGEKRVLAGVDLTIRRGEKVAVIGANGLGKSTLLRILVGRLEADRGEVAWGHEARLGYFPQDHRELMPDPSVKVLDYLWERCPLEGTSYVRGQLGLVLFSGDDVDKKIESLSGGEAARLLFARLSVEKPNVLVLDEPTNHLDLEAIKALAETLVAFDGTVIFVSHNRWFVSEVASRVVEIKESGIVDFPGGYADYLERCGDDHLDADAVLKKAKDARLNERSATPEGGSSWEEQKKRRNRLKVVRDRREKVTRELDTSEARLKQIRDGYCEPGFFERTDAAQVASLEAEEKALAAKVDALMVEWEAVETEIGELAAALGETA
jgi:ATPase subunit of ABC transporter with duplicated ATPase domains